MEKNLRKQSLGTPLGALGDILIVVLVLIAQSGKSVSLPFHYEPSWYQNALDVNINYLNNWKKYGFLNIHVFIGF